ncbi:hypothetical protein J3E69DRAFT_42837 [Trichoderma sp. SZMC 28015]
MAGQKEEREGEKRKRIMKKFGESKGGTSEVTPLRSISSFSFRSRLGFAFAVPGIIALLGMCAQCFPFVGAIVDPEYLTVFAGGRVIPDEDGAEGAGTQGVLPDCFGCWVLQATTVLHFCLVFSAFSFLFPELRGLWWYRYGDMGTRIWEYGIFGVPRGWYCIMTMGFTCAFP